MHLIYEREEDGMWFCSWRRWWGNADTRRGAFQACLDSILEDLGDLYRDTAWADVYRHDLEQARHAIGLTLYEEAEAQTTNH